MALSFIEPELLPMEVLHCGYKDFRPFCSCELTLTRRPIYKLDPYYLEIIIPDVRAVKKY